MKLFYALHRHIKLETLVSALTIGAVITAAGCMMLIVHLQMRADTEQEAIESQQRSLRIGAGLLGALHPDTRVSWSADGRVEKIVMSSVPADEDQSLVDSVTRMTGGPVTLFAYDPEKKDYVRRSTTVKKADGTRAIGTWLGAKSPAYAPIERGEAFNGAADILGIPYYTIYFPIEDPAGKVVGIFFAGDRQDAASASADALEWKILIAAALLIATMAAVGFFISRLLMRPVPMLADVMGRLSRSEATGEIPFADYNNEVGEMARAVAVFRANTEERAKLEADRTRDVERRERRQQALEQLVRSFKAGAEETIAALSVMAGDLERTASSLQDISVGTSEKATLVAGASDQASANVGTVAAASEELTASISDIAKQIEEALRNVASTSTMAAATNGRMAELTSSAQQIGEVVTLIQEIAGQTNLLALNATIEAARAGEAGRGFAVVASEVKTLATRTAQATESISEQVASIQSASDEAVRAISEITARMNEVNSITQQIAASVTQQGAATSEINASVHHAAGDTRHVSETIAGVTEAAMATSSSARKVLETSATVGARTRDLSRRIEGFLDGLAAA
jgi:methyl-accepting chemotaxis protein